MHNWQSDSNLDRLEFKEQHPGEKRLGMLLFEFRQIGI